MAKATKGSADPRAAAGDLSNRDQTTATPGRAPQKPARLPNGRFAPKNAARGSANRSPAAKGSAAKTAGTKNATASGSPKTTRTNAAPKAAGSGNKSTSTGTKAKPPARKPATREASAEPVQTTAHKTAPATAHKATPAAEKATRTTTARKTTPTRREADARNSTGTRPAAQIRPGDGPGEVLTPTEVLMGVHPARPATPPPVAPDFVLPDADATLVAPAAGEAMTPATRKMLQRRRRVMLFAFLGLAVAVLAVGQFVRNDIGPQVTTVVPAGSALPPAQPPAGIGEPTTAAPTATETATRVSRPPSDAATAGPSRAPVPTAFTFVAGYGPVLGTAGRVRRFRVGVEHTIGQGSGADFAHEVDRILGDPRSWIAGRKFRLQRVPQAGASEFTVYLASARTSEKMCAAGGLTTDGYTSCRLPGQVIINIDRWENAVPSYDAPLVTYRAYAINHEVGHQLGYGHESCPGEGRPAPVMQQQTYGLKGCVANAWPYVDGKRYAGNPVA